MEAVEMKENMGVVVDLVPLVMTEIQVTVQKKVREEALQVHLTLQILPEDLVVVEALVMVMVKHVQEEALVVAEVPY